MNAFEADEVVSEPLPVDLIDAVADLLEEPAIIAVGLEPANLRFAQPVVYLVVLRLSITQVETGLPSLDDRLAFVGSKQVVDGGWLAGDVGSQEKEGHDPRSLVGRRR